MGNLKTGLVSVAALLATTIAASAADLPPIIDLPPEVPPVTAHGGWYLRGDIGYAHTTVHGVRYFQGSTQSGRFEVHNVEETWMIGGGFGYEVNDYFRVDWTANYHARSDFIGSSAQGVACSDGTAGATCTYSDNADLQITTLLANAYLDLGTYHGFTPYVGGGIGGAYLHWGDVVNDENCVGGCPVTTEAYDVHKGVDGWRFAYAFHAGAAYDLSANLKIDAGYTYTHITGGEMFGFGRTSGLQGVQGYHGSLEMHGVHVGMRYTFH